MKVYNKKHSNLTPKLLETLKKIRKMRNFIVEDYISAKSILLNQYLSKCGLNTCVVAVSGGIDSAVTLALVKHASEQLNSPIKRIVAVTIPSFDGSVTNQAETIKKAQELCEVFKLDLSVLEITKSCEKIANDVESCLNNKEVDVWARGQLVSYVRTPSLYYFTSVLNSQGFKPVLVGTINRDEGAYLGYLCKAGDACVDLQLISDIHKSEVYQVGEKLNIPASIMSAIPNGDMYDGRVDEDVFGAPYDFVELFLAFKSLSENAWSSLIKEWDEVDKEQFLQYEFALENLHRYNSHKYLAGSSAIHMDVMESAIDGGWIEGVHTTIHKIKPHNRIINTYRFVGFVNSSPILYLSNLNLNSYTKNEVTCVSNILSIDERCEIKSWIDKNSGNLVKTNQYGYPQGVDKTGSSRLSFYDEVWAKVMFERIMASGTVNPIFNEKDANTNWAPHEQWRVVGLNPLFRVLNYTEGELLYPHYDDSYYQSDIRRSLKTVLFVVNSANIGGSTRFIKDDQMSIPFDQRDFSDKDEIPTADKIIQSFNEEGSVLIFNHRMLHDGEGITKGKKIVIRTELMYERITF